ncbi:MAG TPA: DUF1800 domain-containing protein [Blastocatellia bacterium]|nr:DUF1800 domain-containing protein [Blastocatellia bacterium]
MNCSRGFSSLASGVVLMSTLLPGVHAGQQQAPPDQSSRSAQSGQQSQMQAQPQRPGPQVVEQYIARVRNALSLDDAQVNELRQILVRHADAVGRLRTRVASQPFGPQLQADVDAEQRAIRDELTPHLTEEQKAKIAGVDLRPVAPPPAYMLIEIPPRTRPVDARSTPYSRTERLVPAVTTSSKGQAGRLTEDQRALHVLNRITYGPRPGDVAAVKRVGVEKYIEEQLHPEVIDDSDVETRLRVLPTQQMTTAELYQFYPQPQVAEQRAKEPNPPPVFGRPQQIVGELQQQKLVRAVSSNRQLLEVMTDFWFNHFNVFANKDADLWMLTSYERDTIRPHALGKFRDLLQATAESPAMMFYLDNWLSSAPDARRPQPPRPGGPPRPGSAQNPSQGQFQGPPRGADAVMPAPVSGSNQAPAMTGPAQAQTKDSGTGKTADKVEPPATTTGPQPQNATRPQQQPAQPQRKPGINENYARELMELHTMGVDGGYTQKDVQEVARCFTGWTIDRPNQGGGFVFRQWMHDSGSKTVLGVTIPGGGGITDGYRVIEILSRHPSTARFIAKKLCQRFVSDTPPAALVERVTQVFLRTDGDIREVVRAILTSSEFNSPPAFRAKVKSPLELAASAIRAVDGDTNGAPPVHEWLRRMGGPLYQYQAPTGYGEESSRWLNTGALLARINFGVALANGQIPGTRYDTSRLGRFDGGQADLINELVPLVIHTELSAESRRAIGAVLADDKSPSPQPARPAVKTGPPEGPVRASASLPAAQRTAAKVMELLLGSSEFQRR